MTLTQSIATCFKNYATFKGRASRSEFWWFILFLVIAQVALVFVNSAVFDPEVTTFYNLDANGQPTIPGGTSLAYNGGILGDLFFLVALLPWLAVGWRRMHDHGRAGYLPFVPWLFWIAAVLVTVAAIMGLDAMSASIRETGSARVESLGWAVVFALSALATQILNIYWLTRPSDPQTNTYGPNPQEVPQ